MTADPRYRWLVTGGAGFLGVHMCRGLADRRQEVTAYDIAPFPPAEKVDGIHLVRGDVRDSKELARHLAGVDFVVHAAAALALASSEEIDRVNAEGTRIVIEECAKAKVKRAVYVGTTAVYGTPQYHPINEDAPLDPMGPYGIAKAKAERCCSAYSARLAKNAQSISGSFLKSFSTMPRVRSGDSTFAIVRWVI